MRWISTSVISIFVITGFVRMAWLFLFVCVGSVISVIIARLILMSVIVSRVVTGVFVRIVITFIFVFVLRGL